MLDPIVNFFTWIFQWIGRGIGFVIGIILWPFMWAARWYSQTRLDAEGHRRRRRCWPGRLLRLFHLADPALEQFQSGLSGRAHARAGQSLAGNPVGTASDSSRRAAGWRAGSSKAGAAATGTSPPASGASSRHLPTARRSPMFPPIWSTSTSTRMPGFRRCWPRKLGLFGIPWRNTPFLDNKAAFQLGINQVMRRTTTELVDSLGRVRGTSQIDQNLQDARTALAWNERRLVHRPARPDAARRRASIARRSASCAHSTQAWRSARQPSTPAPTICSSSSTALPATSVRTSDILRARLDASNAGWFDPRADDRFWFAYGQLYAYYGILIADALRLCRHHCGAQSYPDLDSHGGAAAGGARHAAAGDLQRQ